jgi:hypothetical protein
MQVKITKGVISYKKGVIQYFLPLKSWLRIDNWQSVQMV